MQAMIDFCTWFLANMPNILLTPPISAFTGLALLAWTGHLVGQMVRLR